MKDGTTIALNLHRIAVEQDFQETLLNEEKCVHCGRELMSGYSRRTLCCGACSRKGLNGRPTTNDNAERKRAKAEKHGWDYDFNKGHGEQFFRAFDNAYNLKTIILQSLGINRCVDGANDAMVKAEHVSLKSALYTQDIATEVGKHLLSGALDSTHLAGKISEECSGSNPDGSVPARQFLSGNLLSLQDIGGQISMAKIPLNPPARRPEARRQFPSIRYELSIEGFSSCVPSYIHRIITVAALMDCKNSAGVL